VTIGRASPCERKPWRDRDGNGAAVKEIVVAFLRDWGTCLDLHLYEEALTHFLGGGDAVVAEANVVTDGRRLGPQRVRLTGRATAFKITALPDRDRRHFEDHTRRFLQHTDSNPSTGSTSPEPPSPSPPSPNNIKDRPPRRQLMPTVLGLLPRRRAAACGRDLPSDRAGALRRHAQALKGSIRC